mgnify:CR=1 FL=1
MFIILTEDQAARVRGDYEAGRLEPVRVVPGLYQLPERLIESFPDAELDEHPTTDDLLATAKAHMKAQAATLRWGKSQLMPYDGETAYADAALAVVTAKIRVLEESGSTDPISFKLTATAWRSWTLTQLKAYGLAIDAHIQACFDNEASLAAQIDAAADIDALNAIDLEAGWP